MRVAAWLLVGLMSVLPAHAQPVTIQDALGRRVDVPAPPQRVVTIFASNTELVAALGQADRIVGIEAYTRYPPGVLDRPLVGGRLGFSVDAVVAQRPDLLIVTPSRQAAHQLVDPMERLGVPVIVLLSRSVDEVLSNLRLVAQVLGVPAQGERVTGALEARLQKVESRTKGRVPPRVVMITGRLGNGLLLVARPDTYTGDAIVRAGARFALGGKGVVPQVSPEAVLAADPDVLLFAGRQQDLDELIQQSGWRDLKAVLAKKAYTVPRAEFLIPGPRTIDGIERLAARLHPQSGETP
ncbi:ABC transporter substrate-binding protein [Reyranella sp. CPCC 100927]|nr:ABC transporter substrate-binding protein [Reyranella sp. CPCC 100927]